ncbi:CynX/NimT family MFS transporter [Rubrobacter naiadicus]|uniref:CynX/NimT family MFS transporter n=1 Tax=Rubrobacter naiadicus TaxID=1392641 RepID=UPI00235E41BB|nr:MFS transporter [Rubrobacter naiadicus]
MKEPDGPRRGIPRPKTTGVLVVVGVFLIAANMRAPITGVGPLLGEIRRDTGLSSGAAGWLTTIPLLAFSVLSLASPGLARRLGLERSLFVAMVLLAAGLVIRSLPTVPALFLGTVVVGTAIAVINVLLPGLIKQDFARSVGVMTGAYTTTMSFMGAVSSGISVPLAQRAGLGWRGALGCWVVLAAAAAVVWLVRLRDGRRAPEGSSRSLRSLLRSPLAWQVTMFMGLQSVIFYVMVTWLPAILRSEGMDAASAGWMLSIFQLVGLPATFLVPALAGRRPSQRGPVVLTVTLSGLGLVGLLLAGGVAPALWVVLMGIGGGSFISLSYTFFSLRAPDAQSVSALSGMAQSFGYLLAAIGPVLFGYLYEATGGWTVPLMLLLLVIVALFFAGLGAARDARITPADGDPGDGRKG